MVSVSGKMRSDLQLRNYALRTQSMYLSRVRQMTAHVGRCPTELTAEEVGDFLRYYRLEAGASLLAYKQMTAALGPRTPRERGECPILNRCFCQRSHRW